jgi:acyl-coenzyme A thioesterase PaaI-like protein
LFNANVNWHVHPGSYDRIGHDESVSLRCLIRARLVSISASYRSRFCHLIMEPKGALIYPCSMMNEKSLQETHAPQSICFGCGPANPKGLRIRSFMQGDEVVAQWSAEPHHEAFPGMVNGGIIGALLDCHSNWTAAIYLMRKAGATQPLCTVTSEFAVKLLRPTPSDRPIRLRAHVVNAREDRATIDASLEADGKVCATCRGIFVAVKPGHPAYHRW